MYGYNEYVFNCKCISCEILRKIKEEQYLSIEEILLSENNILVNNENLVWKILYKFGYDDNLALKTYHIKNQHIVKSDNLINLFKNVNINNLSLDMIREILKFLDTDIIINLKQCVPQLKQFINLPEFNIKRELICFYTKENFEKQILGYGINIKYFKKSNQIQSINVILDLVSQEAFESDCNHSVWNEEFRFWLPIKINNNHVNKSRKIIEQEIADIYFSQKNVNYLQKERLKLNKELFKDSYKNNKFKPKYMLDIISKMLSSMVVDMMKDNVHASVKALNGFCEFHYLLLQFMEWYPEMIEIADQKIEFFITNFKEVNKINYHSLGEFIILLLVSKKFKWYDIKHNFLMESEARNIRWILREIPNFETENNVDVLEHVFEIVNVGKKLNLFTIYFINEVALKIIDDYKFYYGRPKPEIEQEFQTRVKKIKNINNWEQYYQELNIYLPSKRKILLDYKYALNTSKIKKYHQIKKYNSSLFDKISWRE